MRSQNKFSAVIFDLDGTLLNTLMDLYNAVNHALRVFDYPERTVDEVRRFIGNGIVMLIKRAVPQGTDELRQKEVLAEFTAYYELHKTDFTEPYDGIIDVLGIIRENKIKTAVVSNKHNDAARKLTADYFGELIGYTQGKLDGFPPKPDPSSLIYTMNKLSCGADETLYVGDSDVDVLTAHNAGIRCAGVT